VNLAEAGADLAFIGTLNIFETFGQLVFALGLGLIFGYDF